MSNLSICLVALIAATTAPGEPTPAGVEGAVPPIVLERATLGSTDGAAGGNFEVLAGIGEPDGASSSGGDFDSRAGFWNAASTGGSGSAPIFADGFEGG